jgi:hypothetical protein
MLESFARIQVTPQSEPIQIYKNQSVIVRSLICQWDIINP